MDREKRIVVVLGYGSKDVEYIKKRIIEIGLKWTPQTRQLLKEVIYGETLSARDINNIIDVLATRLEDNR